MRLSTTIILLLLVVGLGIYIYEHEREEPTTKERLEREIRPIQFDPAQVDAINLTVKDKTLKLRLKEDTWLIDGPFDDRANPDMVKKLIKDLSSVEVIERVNRKDFKNDDFKKTGLGAAAVEVKLHKGKEKLIDYRFGTDTPIEGAIYASDSADDSRILLARTEVGKLLQQAPDDWRDSMLIRVKADAINRFIISSGSGVMEFTREGDEGWQLIRPLRTKASDDRVYSVLASIIGLKATPIKSIPASSGESPLPNMQLTMGFEGSEKPLDFTLHYRPEGEIPAQISDRKGFFQVEGKIRDLWKMQPNHLRDQHLAQVEPEAVNYLRVRSLKYGEVIMEKDGTTWMLKRFGKTEPANHERIKQLFDKMNIEQIREFVTDSAANLDPYGLQHPFLELEWKTPQKSSRLLFGLNAENTTFAKYEDQPFIYRVSPMIFNSIPPELSRWRGLKIIDANLFAARRIVISQGELPSIILNYQPDDATWKADVAGKEVTAQLDSAKANKLLELLVNFEITDWSSDRTAAYNALKNPSLVLQLYLSDLDQPDSAPKPTTVKLAPTVPGMSTAIYYGQINDDPDTFMITRDQYQELTTPMLK